MMIPKKLFLLLSLTVTVNTLYSCSSDSKVKPEYATLQEVYATADQALTETYQNMKMPAQLHLTQVDALYSYETVIDYPTKTKEEQIAPMQQFIESIGGTFDPAAIKKWKSPQFYYYETDEEYLRIERSGGEVSYNNGSITQLYSKGEEIQIYRLDRGDTIENATVDLNGTSWALSDAKAYTDKYIQEKVMPHIGYSDAKVKTIGSYKMQDGTTQLALEYDYLVNGLPVYSGADGHNPSEFILSPQFSIIFTAPETVVHIRAIRTFQYKEPKKLKDSFITLPSALRLVEQYLASEYVYSVCDIQMQYAAVGKENVAPYQYRPCWCIVLAEEDGKLQAYNQTTVFVDMQNGKICTYDMISGRLDDFKQYE